MPIVTSRSELILARRVLLALKSGPLKLDGIKARLGLPPRARKVGRIAWALRDAGILDWVRGERNGMVWVIVRQPAPGELDPPKKVSKPYEVIVDPIAVGGLEVRAIRFDDTGHERVQVRAVRHLANGNTLGLHRLGLSAEEARAMASALEAVADELEGV